MTYSRTAIIFLTIMLAVLLMSCRVISGTPDEGEATFLAYILVAITTFLYRSDHISVLEDVKEAPRNDFPYSKIWWILGGFTILLWGWIITGSLGLISYPDDQEDWTAILAVYTIGLSSPALLARSLAPQDPL